METELCGRDTVGSGPRLSRARGSQGEALQTSVGSKDGRYKGPVSAVGHWESKTTELC